MEHSPGDEQEEENDHEGTQNGKSVSHTGIIGRLGDKVQGAVDHGRRSISATRFRIDTLCLHARVN